MRTVALPAVKAGDDANAAFLKDDAALITANGRLGAGHNCVVDLRQRYGAAK